MTNYGYDERVLFPGARFLVEGVSPERDAGSVFRAFSDFGEVLDQCRAWAADGYGIFAAEVYEDSLLGADVTECVYALMGA